MGKRRKSHPKKRTAAFKNAESTEIVEAPHSFIIHRGLPCSYIVDLTHDFRRLMQPFTALHLKERKVNRIKDFVSLSSFFHVSHMGIFNKAPSQLSFKVVRMPRGPTLTFKIHQYTLARDVISMTKHQFVDDVIFKSSPLVVMNNFTGEGKHLKLMANTFQNMFPAINLAQVDISTIRRCVLFSYSTETKLIEMRHYSIQMEPVGLSKGVKKLVLGKIPNMTKYEDIADFIINDGAASESEAENDIDSQVMLPQTLKRKGNLENNKSAIRLYEIGPRMTLQLMKIEESLLTGEVLYHDHLIKTEEEKEALRKLIEKKLKLKEYRKKTQEDNLKRKLKEKSTLKRKRTTHEQADESEQENDADYYKQEVGEEPDEELFKNNEEPTKKRPKLPPSLRYKKKKQNTTTKVRNQKTAIKARSKKKN